MWSRCTETSIRFFLFIDSSYIDAGIELAYHGY
nr:MAG TPA: hypothetical protein [Caudoviricetes sp.]